MNSLAFTIPAALVPSALLLWYIYRKDLNREPMSVVMKTFGLGMLLIIPVMVYALPLRSAILAVENPYLQGFLTSLILAAIPEEFFKFLLLIFFCMQQAAFDEEMDGLVYGATASLGFATLENILYVIPAGWETALARALTSVPCHASLGIIMGYYLVRWKDTQGKVWLVLALLIPVALHAGYDFPLLSIRNFFETDAFLSDGMAVFLLLIFLIFLFMIFFHAKKVIGLVAARQKRNAAFAILEVH